MWNVFIVIIGGKLCNSGFDKVTFLPVTVETASLGTVCKPACDALATLAALSEIVVGAGATCTVKKCRKYD